MKTPNIQVGAMGVMGEWFYMKPDPDNTRTSPTYT